MKRKDVQIAKIGQQIVSTYTSHGDILTVAVVWKNCVNTECGKRIKHGNYRIVEDIKLGDKVELLKGFVVLNTSSDGEISESLPKGSIATVENIYPIHTILGLQNYHIALRFESNTILNFHTQGLRGLTKYFRLADGNIINDYR